MLLNLFIYLFSIIQTYNHFRNNTVVESTTDNTTIPPPIVFKKRKIHQQKSIPTKTDQFQSQQDHSKEMNKNDQLESKEN